MFFLQIDLLYANVCQFWNENSQFAVIFAFFMILEVVGLTVYAEILYQNLILSYNSCFSYFELVLFLRIIIETSIITMSTVKEPNPNCLIYDPKVLLEEFKQHLYRLDNRDAPSKMSNEYKKIYSELAVSNKKKRNQLEGRLQASVSPKELSNSIFHAFSLRKEISNCTPQLSRQPLFKRINGKTDNNFNQTNDAQMSFLDSMISLSGVKQKDQQIHQDLVADITQFIIPNTCRSKSAIVRKQADINPLFLELGKKIMMERMFKDRLQRQISNLKQSCNQLKKSLESMKKQFGEQAKKQNKYKEVSYLSSSIQSQTQHVMIKNTKDFRQMVKKQDQTINNLKKYRNNLRRQNQELETKYIQSNKARLKNRPMTYNFSRVSNQKFRITDHDDFRISNGETKTSQFLSKGQIRFMENIEKVLDMLQVKETDYQEIKASSCTKMRNFKVIDTNILEDDRAKKITNVYRFEEIYDMKLQSSCNIIIQMHERLKNAVDLKQKRIIWLNNFKQEYCKQDQQLNQKNKLPYPSASVTLFQENQKKKLEMLTNINNNSKMLIKFINLYYSILMKYRYTYKMSMTLNIEKKNFTQLLYQIEKAFADGLYFQSYQSQAAKSLTAMHPIHHDNISKDQFLQITQKYFCQAQPQRLKELSVFLFNDLRNVLILRKSWIIRELTQITQKGYDSFQKFIQQLLKQCEDIYIEKVKVLSNLFVNCLKSIFLNKYQKKIIQNDPLVDGGLFTSEAKFRQKSRTSSVSQQEDGPKQFLNKNESQSENENLFPQQNPRAIALKLSKMRNKNVKSFKVLNFNVEGNSYAKKIQRVSQSRRRSNRLALHDIKNE